MKKLGTDESGKGDYFGYLVVAGVISDDDSSLKKLGVKDSKKMTDSSLNKAAASIRKSYAYDIVKISPEKYNILYRKIGNLNKLLAWGHARVIENLLNKCDADKIIVDKFAEKKVLESYLLEKGSKKNLVMKVKGEEDPAVAAASILARAEYIDTLRMLGRELGMVLPRGSTHVKDAVMRITKDYGKEALSKLAKMNFKIVKKL